MTDTYAYLYGFGTGGGNWGALTVTAPAGVTVKVSKDGKTYTKTANADGQAVFKGLDTGTWTVTITDGVQTATRTAEVVADYAISLTFFAATINITYPVGSVCTCSDGVTTLTAPDTSGTWACVVPNTGTWTVTANGWSEAVTITAAGEQASVDLVNIYLFKGGDQYTSRTGGWETSVYHDGFSVAGTLTIGNTMDLAFSASYATSGFVHTKSKIDLTNISQIVCTLAISRYFDNVRLAVDDNTAHPPIAEKTIQSGGTYTIDVSALTGDWYVGIAAHNNYQTRKSSALSISEVKLT